jgi:hypothetical membrane protein
MTITQVVGFISAFALIMIGVFSEDYMTQHVFWSDVFFAFNLIVLILANDSSEVHEADWLLRPRRGCDQFALRCLQQHAAA